MPTDPTPLDDGSTHSASSEQASSPQGSQRPQKAYAIFLSLGDGRTYRQVADRMGVALATVKRYAKAGRWQSKIRDHEAQSARQIADRFQSGQLADTDRNLRIVRAVLVRLAQDIAAGTVKGQLADLPRLMQLEQDLISGPAGTDADNPYKDFTTEELLAEYRHIHLLNVRDHPEVIPELIALARQGQIPPPRFPLCASPTPRVTTTPPPGRE